MHGQQNIKIRNDSCSL